MTDACAGKNMWAWPLVPTISTPSGLMIARSRVIAGVVVGLVTVPLTPSFVETETLVTVPEPPPPPPTAVQVFKVRHWYRPTVALVLKKMLGPAGVHVEGKVGPNLITAAGVEVCAHAPTVSNTNQVNMSANLLMIFVR